MPEPDELPEWATGEGVPVWAMALIVAVVFGLVLALAILEGAGVFG